MQLSQLDIASFENVFTFLKPNRVVVVMHASKETNDRSWNIWRGKGPMKTVMQNAICNVFDEIQYELLDNVMPRDTTLGDIPQQCAK